MLNIFSPYAVEDLGKEQQKSEQICDIVQGEELGVVMAKTGEPAAGWFDQLSFRFAKTMPEFPHEYTVRSPETEDAYVTLWNTIHDQGTKERWNGRTYRYWYRGDGFRYWFMGPLGQSRIINRARAEHDWIETGPAAFCRRCGHPRARAQEPCIPPPPVK
jgi:hypothetical protein